MTDNRVAASHGLSGVAGVGDARDQPRLRDLPESLARRSEDGHVRQADLTIRAPQGAYRVSPAMAALKHLAKDSCNLFSMKIVVATIGPHG